MYPHSASFPAVTSDPTHQLFEYLVAQEFQPVHLS